MQNKVWPSYPLHLYKICCYSFLIKLWRVEIIKELFISSSNLFKVESVNQINHANKKYVFLEWETHTHLYIFYVLHIFICSNMNNIMLIREYRNSNWHLFCKCYKYQILRWHLWQVTYHHISSACDAKMSN